MREQKKDYKIWLYLIYVFLLLLIHCFIQTGTNDDSWFAEILDQYSVWEYLKLRYNNWTSRLPIELAVIFLTRWNPWVWKILNIFVILLLIYSLSEVFGGKTQYNSMLVFMLLLPILPFHMHSSAGWISTTVNYLWAITAGVVALIPLSRWERGKKISGWQYVLFTLAGMFGCFQEQVAAVLFAAYAIYIGYRIWNKKSLSRFHLILWIIIGALLVFILSCPGNENRGIAETGKWFPEYAGLSYAEKLLMGYLSALSYYVSCGEYNTTFMLFAAVLFVVVFEMVDSRLAKGVAAIPLFVSFVWGYGGRIIMKLGITSRTYWIGLIQNDQLPQFGVYSYGYIIVECMVFLVVIGAVIGALFFLFGRTIEFGLAFVVLGAALCTRIILGFSPTVYVSGSRTATLGCICIFVLICLCLKKGIKAMKYKQILLGIAPFYLIAVFSAVMVNT